METKGVACKNIFFKVQSFQLEEEVNFAVLVSLVIKFKKLNMEILNMKYLHVNFGSSKGNDCDLTDQRGVIKANDYKCRTCNSW